MKILFAITTWISYALQGYVTADIIWNKYLSKRIKDTGKHILYELLLRAVIVLLTCKLLLLHKVKAKAKGITILILFQRQIFYLFIFFVFL